MSEEMKEDFERQETVDAGTLVARQLQADLKEKLTKLLADPRTPQSFKNAFKGDVSCPQ